MKAFYILIAVLTCSLAFGKEKTLPEVTQVVTLSEIEDELFQGVLRGEHPEVAIECQEGTSFPVGFLHDLGLFSVEQFPDVKINVQKTIYLRVVKKSGYYSFDLTNWERGKKLYGDLPGMKFQLKKNGESFLVKSDVTAEAIEEDDED